ncbi:DUF4365 domain-containing protein [Amycolatopsis sp. GA6-003]|uniref:DUF4365 domain-containing protein n=1 Tax=Amycolatopsis sp. GA6-003 TaxID=2652444 RepID=UPI0039174346
MSGEVSESWRISRDAVNRVRTLIESQGQVMAEIPGHADFGEDFHVMLVENQRRTGEVFALQVKGGKSYRRAGGYQVSVGKHGDFWRKTTVPVICVVHDPELDKLFWVNASAVLRRQPTTTTLHLQPDQVLDAESFPAFIESVRADVSPRNEFLRALSRLSGAELQQQDYVGYFQNESGEPMVFRQRRGEPFGSVFHSDVDWEEVRTSAVPSEVADTVSKLVAEAEMSAGFEAGEMSSQLSPSHLNLFENLVLSGGGLITDNAEGHWLRSCLSASCYLRDLPPAKI